MRLDPLGYHGQAAKTGLARLVVRVYRGLLKVYYEWFGSYKFFREARVYMLLPSFQRHKNVQDVKAPGMRTDSYRYKFVL